MIDEGDSKDESVVLGYRKDENARDCSNFAEDEGGVTATVSQYQHATCHRDENRFSFCD